MEAGYRNLLLIEDEDIDVEVVQRFLAIAGDGEFKLTVAQTVQRAMEILEHNAFDLILLDQRLPDSLEDQTFLAIRDISGHTPIIFLTGLGDVREGAKKVRLGAQDYLVKGQFDAYLLIRVIRYAIERSELQRELEALRLKEKQNEEFQVLENVARSLSSAPNPKPLKETSPAYFQDLVRRYAALLDEAMQRRIYKIDETLVSDSIRKLGRELARIKAGPRELVEVHSAVLKNRLRQETEIKNQAFLEEGRLLLLEAMGTLVREYRSLLSAKETETLERGER